ncbi:hypothetical protein ACEPPN_014592 [Leptodophora sp. 'Broadleaf-Isolate-01']
MDDSDSDPESSDETATPAPNPILSNHTIPTPPRAAEPIILDLFDDSESDSDPESDSDADSAAESDNSEADITDDDDEVFTEEEIRYLDRYMNNCRGRRYGSPLLWCAWCDEIYDRPARSGAP